MNYFYKRFLKDRRPLNIRSSLRLRVRETKHGDNAYKSVFQSVVGDPCRSEAYYMPVRKSYLLL